MRYDDYWLKRGQKEDIRNLYLAGLSCQEIKEKLNLPHSPRSVQRYVKKLGISRTVGEAFRLAVKKGRVTYHTKPNKIPRHRLSTALRALVLERGKYRCVLCGNTADTNRLEIDHIDGNKNNSQIDNLRVLCDECNIGQYNKYKLGNAIELTKKMIEGLPQHSSLRAYPKPGHKRV